MRRWLFLIAFGVGVLVSPVSSKAGPIYWGTAAEGMAGAYTAGSGGFGGISYNPASSATVTNYEFTSNFTRFSQNTLEVENGSVGFGFGLGNVSQGIAINRTSLDFDFENFDVTSEGLGLDYDDNVVYYNASIQPFSTTRLGANAKYFSVQSDVEDASATGYGLDLGFQQMLNRHFILGVSVINLGAERDWKTGLTEDVPRQTRIGLRIRPTSSWSLEGNAIRGERTGFERYLAGTEWWLVRRLPSADNSLVGFALRGGFEVLQTGQESINLSMGLSIKMGFGELHYAFQEQSRFRNQQHFGLTVRFGGGR